jgi:GNAT superfamily N-acetyltransferase
VAYFRELGRNLEWSTFEHDSLPDLHLRLEAHGFVVEEEPESILVLDMERPPDKLVGPITADDRADIRQIVDPAGLDDVLQVEERVWNTDFSWLRNKLGEDLVERPEGIAIYAAYVDDKPVSSGWVFFHHGTHFASLYGGSTLEGYRGRGLYTALVAARMQEAIRRGFRFLSIDAGSMSKPIVANLGFQLITTGYECNLALAE